MAATTLQHGDRFMFRIGRHRGLRAKVVGFAKGGVLYRFDGGHGTRHGGKRTMRMRSSELLPQIERLE